MRSHTPAAWRAAGYFGSRRAPDVGVVAAVGEQLITDGCAGDNRTRLVHRWPARPRIAAWIIKARCCARAARIVAAEQGKLSFYHRATRINNSDGQISSLRPLIGSDVVVV